MKHNILKRTFIPGDEWIYFKLYSGVKTADNVLFEAVKPITELLYSLGKIDQWFFIRYADPESHLRIRFHCSKNRSTGFIVQTVSRYLKKFIEQQLIWSVQIDTYQREIERYGLQAMELSEVLFSHESNLLLDVLPLFKNEDGETKRWIFALNLTDNLLDCFRFTVEDKFHLLSELKDNFGKEFNMNAYLKEQLDIKYRSQRSLIESSMGHLKGEGNLADEIRFRINRYKEIIKPVTYDILKLKDQGQLDVPYENLIASYIHMGINRTFKSKQRLHELVLYDFLYRHYKSVIARTEKKNDSSAIKMLR